MFYSFSQNTKSFSTAIYIKFKVFLKFSLSAHTCLVNSMSCIIKKWISTFFSASIFDCGTTVNSAAGFQITSNCNARWPPIIFDDNSIIFTFYLRIATIAFPSFVFSKIILSIVCSLSQIISFTMNISQRGALPFNFSVVSLPLRTYTYLSFDVTKILHATPATAASAPCIGEYVNLFKFELLTVYCDHKACLKRSSILVSLHCRTFEAHVCKAAIQSQSTFS